MVLWGSVLSLAASAAGFMTLGSTQVLGDLAALAFAISLFAVICAAEARHQ